MDSDPFAVISRDVRKDVCGSELHYSASYDPFDPVTRTVDHGRR